MRTPSMAFTDTRVSPASPACVRFRQFPESIAFPPPGTYRSMFEESGSNT